MLTRTELEDSLPAHLKSSATQALTDRINNALGDPIMAEQFRSNLISYTSVLQGGRFKLDSYIHAVMYVSFKLLGKTDKEAYQLTFPTRWRNLVTNNTSGKDIASYVSSYHKGQLVQKILEQTLTPAWVLNQHVFQETVNNLFQIVQGGKSEMARVQAGNALLNHLKAPEKKEVNINLGIQKTDGLAQLEGQLRELASQQVLAIESGMSADKIAGMPLIEGGATGIK